MFGGGRGPGGGNVELDPLVVIDDASKPLLSKLLAVPALRANYLAYVREMANAWLDWNSLGPKVRLYAALIAEDVNVDTRKLDSYEAFERAVADESATSDAEAGEQGRSLRSFADQRRAYLLKVTSP